MKKVIIWIAVITLLASSFAPVISILLSPAVPTETGSGMIDLPVETGTSGVVSTGETVATGLTTTGASLSGKTATGTVTPKKVVPTPAKPKAQTGSTVKKPTPKKVVSGETK